MLLKMVGEYGTWFQTKIQRMLLKMVGEYGPWFQTKIQRMLLKMVGEYGPWFQTKIQRMLLKMVGEYGPWFQTKCGLSFVTPFFKFHQKKFTKYRAKRESTLGTVFFIYILSQTIFHITCLQYYTFVLETAVLNVFQSEFIFL